MRSVALKESEEKTLMWPLLCREGKPVKRMRMREAEERLFHPQECTVDLLRRTPGINLFELNKREQLNLL